MKSSPVAVIAALLCTVGLSVCAYKVVRLGMPLAPSAQAELWVVEVRVGFEGRGRPVKAQLALPESPPGFRVLDEDFVSRGFGLATGQEAGRREAQWAIRSARGPQALYYRLTLQRTGKPILSPGELPGYPEVPQYSEMTAPAVETLLNEVRATSADIASFTRQTIIRLNRPGQADAAVAALRDAAATPEEHAQLLVDILAGARIPARVVHGIALEDGILDGQLQPWLEVHNEQQWLAFDPRTGDTGYPPNFLIWHRDTGALANVEGGRGQDVRLAVRRDLRDRLTVAKNAAALGDDWLLSLSPLRLPVHIQNVYAVLLTIPVGAFLVVVLRNVVGIRSFGTFMPVLIALAFRETRLLWGLVLFSLLVAVGLLLRFALERMKLLLVPRLASVLTMVILLMLAVSLFSDRLDLERGLSVALFPMVILAMTIERMSIVWDEHGSRDAILQGLGSLVVAAVAYLLMTEDHVEHLVFVFPELLLVVLAATLLLGRYTGYRLTEYWRFRAALRPPPDAA